MRKLWWVGCALTLVACGRIAQGDDDVLGSNDAQLDCTYGKIASVPGLPLSLASTGKSIFVVSYDVGGEIGDLRAITSDGTVHLLVNDNAALTMIPTGSSMVFSRRSFDQQQNLLGETINIVDENFAISQLDTTNDNIVQVDSLTGDGQDGVYWQRLAKGNSTDIPTELGSVSLEKYTGDSVVTVAGNSGTSWASDIVSDGVDFYGLLPPTPPDYSTIVGRLGIGPTPQLVLATTASDFIDQEARVYGVDDTNVVYYVSDPDLQQGAGIFAVPKNGGTPMKVGSIRPNAAILHDHHVYWVEQNGDGTTSVLRVATSGQASVEKVATENTSIGALAVDACGVIYAVTDSASPGLTGTTIYRSKI